MYVPRLLGSGVKWLIKAFGEFGAEMSTAVLAKDDSCGSVAATQPPHSSTTSPSISVPKSLSSRNRLSLSS